MYRYKLKTAEKEPYGGFMTEALFYKSQYKLTVERSLFGKFFKKDIVLIRWFDDFPKPNFRIGQTVKL